jgi:hypothetical protein
MMQGIGIGKLSGRTTAVALLAGLLGGLLLSGAAVAQDAPRVATDMEKKAAAAAAANEPGPWNVDANLGALLTQSAFSSNWAKGDRGSFTWTLLGDLTAQRQMSHKFNWHNFLRLGYGQTGKQVADPNDPNESVWEPPSKTTDQILAESTGRFTLGAFADPFVGIRLDSQFEDESSPFGTLTFNPIRLTETAGLARVFRKTEHAELISRLGVGARQTFGREFLDADTKRSFSTNDGGLEWLTTAVQPLTSDNKVVYKGRLLVFAPVFYSQSGDLETFDEEARMLDPSREEVKDFWRVPDVDFQNEISAQITKIVSVSLLGHMIYDKFDANTNVDLGRGTESLIPTVDGAIRKGAQWRQTLALGLTWKMF